LSSIYRFICGGVKDQNVVSRCQSQLNRKRTQSWKFRLRGCNTLASPSFGYSTI